MFTLRLPRSPLSAVCASAVLSFLLGVGLLLHGATPASGQSASTKAPYSDRPPGQTYTEQAQGSLRVGLAQADITPTWPVEMLYGADQEVTSAYDRTWAKVMILEASGTRFAIIEYDVIGIRKETSEYIKGKLEKRTSLKRENIIVAGTHNHSYTSTDHEKTRRFITKKTISAVSEAEEEMFDARIGIKKTHAREDLNLNRAELRGEANSRLYVMKIEDSEGHLRGIHYNYGSHPTIFTEWGSTQGQIGPEWPGYVNRYIQMRKKLDLLYKRYQQKIDVDANPWVMFSEGAAGDQQPRRSDIQILGERKPDRKVFAEKLAWEVLHLTEKIETTPNVTLKMSSSTVELARRDGGMYRTLVQSLVINNSVLSTIPGELDVELARMFMKASPYENNLFITLSDDVVGYIVPDHLAIERVTYQSKGVEFRPSYGEHIIRESLRLIDTDPGPLTQPDPAQRLGGLSGTVNYTGDHTVAVGVKRMPSGPNYAGGFWGRRAVIDRDGNWEIDSLSPGSFFLYAVEADPDRPAPTRLKSGYEDLRDLIVGYPVEVQPNETTQDIDFTIPSDYAQTDVEGLSLDSASLNAEGYSLFGRINVEGQLSENERITVGVYPAQLTYRALVAYLRDPVMTTRASPDGSFSFESLPPGRYRVATYVDVNQNGLVEPVDVTTSPTASPVVVIRAGMGSSVVDAPPPRRSGVLRSP